MTKKTEIRSINLPFCGFYESSASRMIDDEIEQAFDYSDGGGHSHIPDEIYFQKEYAIDYRAIEIELVKAYVDAFADRFEGETGIDLKPKFEAMTSPREYNFETDRVFIDVPFSVVKKLYAASVKDNHTQLAEAIKDQCTSYNGFFSYYSNEVELWLQKPLKEWDHNELKILLMAVAAIHCDTSDWDLWDLMENWTGNGGLSNAVWSAMPQATCEFAEMQRGYGKAVDFALWVETGKCYPDGTTQDEIDNMEPLPEPRCKDTLELPL